MKVAVFDTHNYDREALEAANVHHGHELTFMDTRLTTQTARLAEGCQVVCSFVNDRLDAPCLQLLQSSGVRLIALRSAGFNHVDLAAAKALGLPVVRVPEYSPYAVAEHAVALILSLNRKIHKAYNRVREANFSLDGLVGFDLHGKTVSLIGTGKIGAALARIMRGFGCRLLAYDLVPNAALAAETGLRFTTLEEVLSEADILSLHVPLTPQTRHLINAAALARMKPSAMLINTGRGALVDTRALIDALKARRLGAAGLDVYEEEEGVFFQNLSEEILQDDTLVRLLSFPNVLITSHQGFLTQEALANIAETTLGSISAFESGAPLQHAL
jgi:D-lactate dehydrogenase